MSEKGKIIVVEGTDASGKETQTKKLYERLLADNLKVRRLSFPQYGSPWARPVEQYLSGALGPNPEDVTPFGASLFYAIDRYASYKADWGKFYLSGGILICDRYTTSNALHQTSKLPLEKREEFLHWLYDLEYNKLQLPKPDMILFLNVDDAVAEEILCARTGKEGIQKDIHETHLDYLRTCRENGRLVAKYDNWTVIQCTENNQFRTREAIHEEIFRHVNKLLKN